MPELEELIQLRYADDDGDLTALNAAELASVLQGLVEFVSEAGKAGAFGDRPPPAVMVRPPKEGSFILEAVLHWVMANPDTTGLGMTATGGVVVAVRAGLRKLNGEVKDYERLENGKVKIKWNDDTAQEVEVSTWELLNKRHKRTKRALAKILAPMASEADTLTLTADPDAPGEQPVVESATRADYRAAIAAEPEGEERTEVFEIEGTLRRIDFQPNSKWRVATTRGTRSATVEDDDFLRRVNEGLPLKKTDIFRFRIREETVQKARRSTTWVIEKVLSHRPGSNDDDNSAVPSSSTSAS